MARKTLKEGMLETRRNRRAKTRVATRVQLQGHGRDLKAVDIEATIVDKVVPNVLVDGGSELNILPEQTMKKVGFISQGYHPSSSIWLTRAWRYLSDKLRIVELVPKGRSTSSPSTSFICIPTRMFSPFY